METFKAAGNYVRLPVTVLPVSAPLHTTTALCAAQREVHVGIEFEGNWLKKKTIPSNYGEDEINIFLALCVSGEIPEPHIYQARRFYHFTEAN